MTAGAVLFGAGILIVLALLFALGPSVADRLLNRVGRPGPHPLSEPARSLHRRLLVADLHADSLLWSRDLLARNARGHVDVPRLLEGNVALQAFTIVTKTPRDMNVESTSSDTLDLTALLTFLQRRPVRVWRSPLERALDQCRALRRAAARSGGALRIIESRGDLERFLAERRSRAGATAGFLGVEGLHCLQGSLENLEVLYRAGVRMMGLTHFFDNEVGGSAHGRRKGGLTELGRRVVRRIGELEGIIDLAHASVRVIEDVLAMTPRPVLVSHTGVRGTCDNNRNLSDASVRAIASGGGLLGIGFWKDAAGSAEVRSIVRAIRYVCDLVGVEHVALGSDFDGCVRVPFDASGMGLLTEALVSDGFHEEEIARIMGGNVVRFLLDHLPQETGTNRPPQ
ncbi:MAG: membrane dipeptidase [bacterium]